MGIKAALQKLFPSKPTAPLTSGAAKAAEGRSDLADLANKLDDIRGDNVTPAGGRVRPPSDNIADVAVAAKQAQNSRAMNSLNVRRYRRSK